MGVNSVYTNTNTTEPCIFYAVLQFFLLIKFDVIGIRNAEGIEGSTNLIAVYKAVWVKFEGLVRGRHNWSSLRS